MGIEEDGEEKKQQQNNHSNHNSNNDNNNSSQKPLQNGHTLPPSPQQQNNGNSNHINSTLPQPKKPNNILPKANDPLLNGAHEYLKKQRRCTYFNAELDFAHFLEGVSSALEQCDRKERGRLLQDNIIYANKCLP